MCSLRRDILNGNCALQMREIWALSSWRGVLYLKLYLTAWINSPLFRCWAGARPLLVLSFNNHAGCLSPLQCTVSYTGITNPGSTARVRAQSAIILPGRACTTEVPAVWICQWIHVKINCTKSLLKTFPSSPSHILKCSPDLNHRGLRPRRPLIYQKVFLKQKSVEPGTVFWELFHTHRQKCEKETLRKFMILCVFWSVRGSFSGVENVIF